MQEYNLTCNCGQTMTLQADNRDAAVAMFKSGMDEAAITQHFGEFHKGEAVPAVPQVHAMVEQMVSA